MVAQLAVSTAEMTAAWKVDSTVVQWALRSADNLVEKMVVKMVDLLVER